MELTLDEALKKGMEAHKAGQIQEAKRLYTAILNVQPKHPDANHNMGALAVGVGQVQEALPFFRAALVANPSIGQFWVSYIGALIKLGRLSDAQATLDQAKDKGASGEIFDQLEQQLTEQGLKGNEARVMAMKVPDFSRPNTLDTLKLDKALRLAKSKSKDGDLEEAKNIYEDILQKFPKHKKALLALQLLGGGATAVTQDSPQGQLQSIINLYTQGKLQQAISHATEMLERFPNSVTLYNIVGVSNAGLKQFDAAAENYSKAIKINPAADLYYNMGNALIGKGNSEAAIDSYKQAIKLKPNYADAYYNMGNALKIKHDFEAAIDSYKQALKIKPDYAEAYYNMGNALKSMGDVEAAIESYVQAVLIKPDYVDAYNNMSIAMDRMVFTKPNAALRDVITSMLNSKNYVRPRDISMAAISLLKFEPAITELFKKHSAGEVMQSLERLTSNLSEVPLLCQLMNVCPLNDSKLEIALQDVRLALLLSVSEISNCPGVLRFQSALALQCFTNEYVYSQNDKETKALVALEVFVEETLLKGKQPRSQFILCLASYKALYHYKWSNLLNLTAPIEDVFTRQVLEPKQESCLKLDIPALQDITDKVSSEVMGQYEANPYPRWISVGLRLDPAPISKVTKDIRLKLFDKKINDVEAPNILIAGCGTGQHSICTASRFKNAKVLAVDLSLSSLAYAKRKTEELGVQNLEYMQADILDLGRLGRTFDIIESAGVLHHMGDPMAGWRVLVDCLELGGLINIGLYSELARQNIVAIREEISQSGIGSSDLAMKSFRSEIINSNEERHKSTRSSSDLYSLSSFRDLLFHVQEHRFTIPQIQKCLDALGLKFCGFEADRIVRDFRLTNTGADDPYDLGKWHSYEESNPSSFGGMYQFWCQKVV